jgi:alkaline phosphatase
VAAALLGSALLALPACSGGDEPAPPDFAPRPAPVIGGEARNVILVNGDGMSAAHREAARLEQQGFDGELAMDVLPVSGLQTTAPRDPDATVTDSAAAATAWATGQKTRNGSISVDVDGEWLTPLGREAKAAGLATGLVTTAEVTDASPAAFFSNVADRDQEAEIAAQYLQDDGPSVILGGGADVWDADLLAQAEDAGFSPVTDPADLDAGGDRLFGLFAGGKTYQVSEGEEGDGVGYGATVDLAALTTTALDVVSRDEDGFFLIVEEEGVDTLSHDNDGAGMLAAMRSLDAAVRVALEYVTENPDTLLIVTGDHDAGGLTIEDPDGGENEFPVAGSDRAFELDWSSPDHTGTPVPVTAAGPGSDALAGSYPNTYLHQVMRAVLID